MSRSQLHKQTKRVVGMGYIELSTDLFLRFAVSHLLNSRGV
jgi:hypothetical protein